MQRLQPLEEVRRATANKSVVIACSWHDYMAEDVQAALPPGFAARRFAGELRDGAFIKLVTGPSEAAVRGLLESGAGGADLP